MPPGCFVSKKDAEGLGGRLNLAGRGVRQVSPFSNNTPIENPAGILYTLFEFRTGGGYGVIGA